MDNNSVYEYLLDTNEWERKALEYIKQYGRKPSGIDLLMIYNRDIIIGAIQEDKASKNLEAWEGYRRSSESLHSFGHIVYQEEECFLPGSNIELCKVERYVDNILHTHEFFEG